MIHTIQRGRALRGTVLCPGDKSISHRYAMLAALAHGTSEVRNFSPSLDCRSTLQCLRSLGVEILEQRESILIPGRGLRGLTSAAEVLDAGNSGTTIRLLSGILAGQHFSSTITGDESLSRRPMARIIEPLRLMGAKIEAADGGLPPLRIRGGGLRAVRYELPVASAQVKSCILLAGLFADGLTAVREPVATRNHTEIALRQFGAAIRLSESWIEIEPEPKLNGLGLSVPCDLSSAAFFITAAALIPGSEILLHDIGTNPSRRALLDYLKLAGVDLAVLNESESAGEARGDIRVQYDPALPGRALPPIQAELTASLIDEIPVLSVLGALSGGLVVRDARELRVKESDRLAAIARNLRAMGAEVEEHADGIAISGGRPLRGAKIETWGDHRIAMAFSVAGLAADGVTHITQAECAGVSFPQFFETLARLRQR